MCGVVGLIFERSRSDLGQVASELLRTLEYRGYDSTGAAIQGAGEEVDLRKDVGAPSLMVHKLGIVDLPGQIFCGQVRWATFGAVDQRNAQPHMVRCKIHLYGAHNGNVTNCDALKVWLIEQGHHVLSDNDGEMVVHSVEHAFAARIEALPADQQRLPAVRRGVMRAAILETSRRLEGSYAAVIVDPVSRCLWAIKQGSSLYFGVGDGEAGRFHLASSDLSSILKHTRNLVPLGEGEMVEFDATGHQLYRLGKDVAEAQPIARAVVRSRLRATDTALKPPFRTFMEQEIDAEEETCRGVIRLFTGGSPLSRELRPVLDALSPEARAALHESVARALDGDAVPASSFAAFEAAFPNVEPSRLAAAIAEREEVDELEAAADQLVARAAAAVARGGRIYLLSCGTSFHAAKAAALFFNAIASVEVTPLLPGEFRGQSAETLRDGDVLIAVSQSGETKDLIDVVSDVIKSGKDVFRVALVNNVNSTLGQEKCQLVLPLRCGPEIAVAATKSFINQLTVFYCLAVRLAEHRSGAASIARRATLARLPELIRATLVETDAALERASELLYLAPSIQILATRLLAVAKEGALKIREVVLNHTEGFEASEFKHGPNTILGVNTVFGLSQLEAALSAFSAGLSRTDMFAAMRADYPLVYVTGPNPRDVDLTISQINTHKIRGVSTVVIAEDEPRLRNAVEKAPADNPRYVSVFVALPPTGDTLLTVFSASVALQNLALKMSLRKMAHLDRVGFANHGVHPDVPKNVSKSITVD